MEYYLCDQINKNEIGRASSMYKADKKVHITLRGKDK